MSSTGRSTRSRIAYVRKHLRLWRLFAVQAAVRESHYRASMLTHIAVGVLQLLLALIPVLVLYSYTDDIRGWGQGEVLALVGLFQAMMGALETFLAPNMSRMAEYITRGNLDGILLRPVSSQFQMMFRWLNLPDLANVVTGLTLMTIGLVYAGATPDPGAVAGAVVLALCGLVSIACSWAALICLAFWTGTVGGVTMFFLNLLNAGRYPVAFFPAAARLFFTFAVPLAFVSTFPIQVLTGAGGGLGWWWIVVGLGMSTVGIFGLRLLWSVGLRRYASASS